MARRDWRCGMDINRMFQPDPGDQSHAEYKVEQSLIRDREDDKCWRECEEEHHQTVDIVPIGI